MPAADVVIPTHHEPPGWLDGAIHSALACPCVGRVIVVDDGPDRPADPAVPGCDADRVIVIRNPGRGVSAARNIGLDASSAPWTVYLDADDELLPAICGAIEGAERTGAALALPARILFWPDGREELKPVPPEWAGRAVDEPHEVFRPLLLFSTTGATVRTDTRERAHFDDSLQSHADKDYFRRLAALAPFYVHPEPGVRYRKDPSGRNLSGHARLEDRVPGQLRVLHRYHDAAGDRNHYEATRWLLNQYSKHGDNPAIWAMLIEACTRYGWKVPRRPRGRFRKRMKLLKRTGAGISMSTPAPPPGGVEPANPPHSC